jgi:2-oxoglutarate dehydrogenase E2 component (dihydrolipoamide succinyltransferase)
MKQDLLVPEAGESVSSGILSAWLAASGDIVEEGQEVFELETDKATLAVPSPYSGRLEVAVEEGEEVEVGTKVGSIDTDAAAEETPREDQQEEDTKLSPAVRRIVSEYGLDPSSIEGSGRDGRITKADAQKAAEQSSAGGGKESPEPGGSDRAGRGRRGAAAVVQEGPAAAGTHEEPAGGQRREKMSLIRRKIAVNLVSSKQNAAHLTTFNEIDMSAVKKLRARYREAFEKQHGVRLGFMSFFIKAAVEALRAYPEVNAFIDGEDILYHDYYHIAVALSSDRGLLTPVIKNADRLSFARLEEQILAYAEKAKNKRILPDELSGATFTITNGGVFGSLLSTPIPNPPQTAILGMHAIQDRPVAINNEVTIRPMMYAALTYDHRVIDGREAIGFLVKIKDCIEDPSRMLLEV